MIPEELYKRRRNHNNTPTYITLIITNYIVLFVGASLLVSCNHIHWFFWVIAGFLAVYNFFSIRRNREEYIKPIIIAYVASLVIIAAVLFYWTTIC
ncbi:hypothetical protein GCM10027049_25520 [Mucilaginibacter puniceus]